MAAGGREIADALIELDRVTRRLRRECPWDREQDARSIVPHTVEEAYELADAANRGDDGKLLDELGDVLFQVHFLALLLEERGAGSLAAVADHCRAKLIRRHPHIYEQSGGTPPDDPPNDPPPAETSAQVLRNWDKIKRTEDGREPGLFGEVPDNLPGPLYARKVQRRAASSGFDFGSATDALAALHEEVAEVGEVAASGGRDVVFAEVGDVLFAAVNVSRKLKVDPELALRASADRFRGRVEAGAALAAAEGRTWDDLPPEEQLAYYARARLAQPGDR